MIRSRRGRSATASTDFTAISAILRLNWFTIFDDNVVCATSISGSKLSSEKSIVVLIVDR